jgi:signal transduction histidine kinase
MVRRMENDPHQGDRAEAGRLLALGSVVPGVVHELNNALLGLLGMLELAQAEVTGAVADRLGIAQQAGAEIREIARVLGALAREPLDGGAADAKAVAGEVVEAARALNVVRGLELVEVFAPDPVSVVGGSAGLRQALLLLLASGFTRSGREGPLLVEVGPEDGVGRLCVRHSGAGAADAADPGVAHVRAWAESLGGTLAVERTRLTLTLPLT